MPLPAGPLSFPCLEAVADPRLERHKRHQLVDILVIALCGFLAGCEGWVDVALFGRAKRTWLAQFLELPNGIPSHDTFGRVFALLDPQQLAPVLRPFVQAALPSLAGQAVAIDGKALRGSGQQATAQQALHLVSAWATERGVVLGQVPTAGHSNEITAIPELLRLLDLRGATVTIDAMGCQKEIARQLRGQGADYVLAVKDNQKNLAEAIDLQLRRTHAQGVSRSKWTTRERDHGRSDERTYTAMEAPAPVKRQWPDAQSIVRVCRVTTDAQGTKRKEVRDFLSSAPVEVQRLAAAIRGHWGIENGLHWVRDVTFAEDASQVRTGSAPQIMAALRNLSSAYSTGPGRSTSPPRCATTAATHADHWPPSESASDEPDITRERRGPGT
jgi:predicted transposase YbfD/YdcC